MKQYIKNNNLQCANDIVISKNGFNTYNPTEELILADGWIEYVKPEPTQPTEADYWSTVDYNEAVNTEIRKKYSESEEFALLRQRDSKPIEFEDYNNYCEDCKTKVKSKIALYKI